MQDQAYEVMAQVEHKHWWFRARQAILLDFVRQNAKPSSKILDIGCGTGYMVEGLGTVAEAWGADSSELARKACHEANLPRVFSPEELLQGVSVPRFDLLCFFDVLEHAQDDRALVSTWLKLLKPEAKIIVSVPAYQMLWGNHDLVAGHFRRYTGPQVDRVFQDLGFKRDAGTYFNTLLFPVVLAVRWLGLRAGNPSGDMELPSAWINAVLFRIFYFERWLLKVASFPFGVSYLGVYSKKH